MFGRNEGMFSEVRYEASEQSWSFDEIVTVYRQAYAADILEPRFVRGTKPLTKDEENALCADKLHVDIWRYIVSCKSPVFRPEREVRFIYIAHRLDVSWFSGHPKEMFRESGGRIIPHLSSRHLDIAGYERNDEIPRLPIRSVWVGPADDQPIIARGIRRLLDGNGYDQVEVVQSSTPFRG
jgi:hypothetical protein